MIVRLRKYFHLIQCAVNNSVSDGSHHFPGVGVICGVALATACACACADGDGVNSGDCSARTSAAGDSLGEPPKLTALPCGALLINGCCLILDDMPDVDFSRCDSGVIKSPRLSCAAITS